MGLYRSIEEHATCACCSRAGSRISASASTCRHPAVPPQGPQTLRTVFGVSRRRPLRKCDGGLSNQRAECCDAVGIASEILVRCLVGSIACWGCITRPSTRKTIQPTLCATELLPFWREQSSQGKVSRRCLTPTRHRVAKRRAGKMFRYLPSDPNTHFKVTIIGAVLSEAYG